MGADNSKSLKSIKQIDFPPKYVEYVDEQKIVRSKPNDITDSNFLKMLYVSYGNDLFDMLHKKNIVIDFDKVEITEILDDIIAKDDIKTFQIILSSARNPKALLKSNYKNKKLFEYIYDTNFHLWQMKSEIIQYVDITYANIGALTNWCVGDTILHTACWFNKPDLIKKIIMINKDLLFATNEYGFMPLMLLLIGSHVAKHDYSTHNELFTFICSKYNSTQLLQILKHHTSKVYDKKSTANSRSITIPINSSFANIVEIIRSAETDENNKIILDNNKIILENILGHLSTNKS